MNDKRKTKPPGVARQLVTFSCFAKEKVTKKKATPVYRPCGVPCVARLVRRLRNSHDPLRVHVLKQSSPTSPDQPALLGGAQGEKIKNLKPQNRRVGTLCSPCSLLIEIFATQNNQYNGNSDSRPHFLHRICSAKYIVGALFLSIRKGASQ